MGKYLVVYLCIFALAGLQFVIAYQASRIADVPAHAYRCYRRGRAGVSTSCIWQNRGLLWFVVVFTVFVLLAMQYGWTDSFRISAGAPWAK